MNAHFGMIGLGTIGRNFLLNIAEHEYAGVGFDSDKAKLELLVKDAAALPVSTASDLVDLVARLETPRNIMLCVPADVVDSVINDLLPYLGPDDLIMDASDSHFTETDRREAELAAKNIGLLSVGIAGGEAGARHGASIMTGGRRTYYDRVKPIFDIAAMEFNRPCSGYVGSGSAGHFVKMVHDGIEYAMMQQIAEAYDYMRRVLKQNIVLIGKALEEWEDEELCSNLIRATRHVLEKYDKEAKQPMVDLITDTAIHRGMGKWASQTAMELDVPVPTINAAVTMRQISGRKKDRDDIGLLFKSPTNGYNVLQKAQLDDVRYALYCGFILAYEQGFSLLRAAEEKYSFGLDLREIAGIWSHGANIYSTIPDKIARKYPAGTQLPSLMLEDIHADALYKNMAGLRKVVASAAQCRIPAMALAASMNYYTSFRTERLPTFLIQAQHDYFGAGKFERIDKKGTFHIDDWETPTYG